MASGSALSVGLQISTHPAMYWLNIAATKRDLVSGELGDARAFPYAIAYLTLTILSGLAQWINYAAAQLSLTFMPEVPAPWNWLFWITNWGIFLLGFILVYRVNGGRAGNALFARTISLYWVVGNRMLLAFFPLLLAYVLIVRVILNDPEGPFFGALIGSAYLVLLWWRVSVHIREVANLPNKTLEATRQ